MLRAGKRKAPESTEEGEDMNDIEQGYYGSNKYFRIDDRYNAKND